MRDKIFVFLVLGIFGFLWIGCNNQGTNKMTVDHSSFRMDEISKDRIIKNLPNVKLGDNRQRVIELLGQPYDNVGIAEPKTGMTKLKLLVYYFSIEDKAVIKETDPLLNLYFTKDDKLYDAYTNAGLSIDKLKAKK